MPLFKTCKATFVVAGETPGSNTYFFKQREGIYIGTLSTATGIDEADPDELDMPCVDIEELLKSGFLFRIKAYGKDGNKNKSASLLCSKTKLGTVADDLVGKVINNFTIRKASFPRRATYY